MSGKVKSRYDKWIPLFGRDDDMRVRLFINEFEELYAYYSQKQNGTVRWQQIVFSPVIVRIGGADVELFSPRLLNMNFFMRDNPEDDSDDNLYAIHSDWRRFLYQLAYRLEKLREVDGGKLLSLVHELSSNTKPGSIENIVWLLLNKVAVLRNRDDVQVKDQRNAGSVSYIQYENRYNIVQRLDPGQHILPTTTDDELLMNSALNLPNGEFTRANCTTNAATVKAAILAHNHNPIILDAARNARANLCDDIADVVKDDITDYEFGYKIDKFMVNLMMEQALNVDLDEAEPSLFFSDDNMPSDAGRYFRKGPESLLYERDPHAPNGERAVYMGSDAFKNMTINKKCLTTGVGNGDEESCAEYLRECLAGKGEGVEKCKRFMKDHHFWENAKRDAENILPPMLVKTLIAFGFEFKQYKHDVTKQDLYKVVSVEEWLSSLKNIAEAEDSENKLDKTELKQIVKNEKLRGYLAMLVKRVNENPIILNPNYNGPNNMSDKPESLTFGVLPRFGLKLHMPANDIMSMIERTNVMVGDHINNHLRAVAVVPMFGMVGGSVGRYVDPIERATNTLNYPKKQSWVIMKNQYEGLKDRLNIYKKSISKNDDITIRNLIDKLRESEIKLTKTMLYAEKYAKLLEVFGVNDGRSILSFDHLAKFVDAKDSYLNKVRERQNSLTSIIKTVAEAVAKESSKKGDVEKADVQTVSGKAFLRNL
jgi:hypothetical protein